ncbi:MAG: hypothetical protein V4808_16735 [Pseudomonadota bacterium]
MRAIIALGGLVMLAACGGGGTTGTNYADAPPVADIVETPSPRASETPTPEAEAPAAAENGVTNIL